MVDAVVPDKLVASVEALLAGGATVGTFASVRVDVACLQGNWMREVIERHSRN